MTKRDHSVTRHWSCVVWAARVLAALLPLVPLTTLAATLYWNVSEEQLAGHSSDIPLLDKDRNVVARVPRQQLRTLLTVKEKIAAAAGQYGVVLAVSNDDTANAFAGRPNGQPTVVFTIPMIRRLGDDEHLIAAIMAHEFGHLAYNHSGRAERTAATTAIGIIAGIAAGLFIPGPLASNLAANAVDLTSRALIHSYDRDQEREADAYGVDVMAKGGFDPQAAMRLWSSNGNMNAGGGLFSTHPATDERLANVQRIVAARTATSAGPITKLASSTNDPPPITPPAAAAARFEDAGPPQAATAAANSGEAPAVSPPIDKIAQDQDIAAEQAGVGGESSDRASASDNGRSTFAVAVVSESKSKASAEFLTYAKNGLAPARNEQGLWGYKDASGKWVIAPTFQQARSFDDSGLAAVAVGLPSDLRWGFINSLGSWAISARFDDAGSFGEEHAGYARVRVGSEAFGQTKYVSMSGELTDRLP